jgi:hypothetical protein
MLLKLYIFKGVFLNQYFKYSCTNALGLQGPPTCIDSA